MDLFMLEEGLLLLLHLLRGFRLFVLLLLNFLLLFLLVYDE